MEKKVTFNPAVEKNCRISFRATGAEMREIKQRAQMDNKTVNQYLKDCALGRGVCDGNGKLRCDMMRQLCKLESEIRMDYMANNAGEMYEKLQHWKVDTENMLLEVQ